MDLPQSEDLSKGYLFQVSLFYAPTLSQMKEDVTTDYKGLEDADVRCSCIETSLAF